jgi:outer membrane protein TolC
MKNILNIIKGLSFSVVLLAVVSSCMVRKEYNRPNNVVDEKLYRTDMLPSDSTNIANVSWKEIFTDPILQRHISKALENNLDIRIALQSIASAEAYLKQSKAAYQPTLSIGPNYTFQTQSINTQFGQIIGERRYINQFDITASIGWEADIWGRLKSQEKAQLAAYLGTVAAHKAVKSDLVASVASA